MQRLDELCAAAEPALSVKYVPTGHVLQSVASSWSDANVAMIRDEVERLVDSDDYVDGVEVDVVGDAMRDYGDDSDGGEA